jgi:predicted cupin superfamily sugar epimerase
MSMQTDFSASDLIRLLDLKPHPEGGHYRETLRDSRCDEGRAVSTAIYFLLAAGEESRWHRIDSVEVWHWYAGAPLLLSASVDGDGPVELRLGMDLAAGERPQAIVPASAWQLARSLDCGRRTKRSLSHPGRKKCLLADEAGCERRPASAARVGRSPQHRLQRGRCLVRRWRPCHAA